MIHVHSKLFAAWEKGSALSQKLSGLVALSTARPQSLVYGVSWVLATQRVTYGPAALASTGKLLEMQNLGHESESAF